MVGQIRGVVWRRKQQDRRGRMGSVGRVKTECPLTVNFEMAVSPPRGEEEHEMRDVMGGKTGN